MQTVPWRMVEIDRVKYVWHLGDRPELFDLRRDPFETVNLADAPDRADDRARLHTSLRLMMADTGDPLLAETGREFR